MQNFYDKTRFVMAIVALLVLSVTTLNAQVKIGLPAGAADASSVLDASNTGGGNKGFLGPKVALTGTTTASPVTSPATGLLVYNTATAGTVPTNVVPGYYYWSGTQWVALIGTVTATGTLFSKQNIIPGASANFITVPVSTNSVDNSWELTVTEKDGCALNATYKFVLTSVNFGGSAFVGAGGYNGALATTQVTSTRTSSLQTWTTTGILSGCGDGNSGITDAMVITLTYTTVGSNTTAAVSIKNNQTAGTSAHTYYVTARQLF